MNEHELQPAVESSHAEALAPQDAVMSALDDSPSAHVREEIERRFQSAKDKCWGELERQYGALAAHQPPDAEALRARAATLVGQAGLLDDPATAARLAAPDWGLADYLGVLEAAATAALARGRKAPATPAQAIQPGGGGPPPDLDADYQRRLRALRPGDVNGLLALKREFRAKGLAIF